MRCIEDQNITFSPDQLTVDGHRAFYASVLDDIIDRNGNEISVRQIERMSPDDRFGFEAIHPEFRFVKHVDNDVGFSWTEIQDTRGSQLAIIDVRMKVRTNVNNGEISIQSPESNVSLNSEGITIQEGPINETGKDNIHELVANEYNVVLVNHERTPTTETWTISGTTTTLADIEKMDWWQRYRLIDDVQAAEGGNVLSFRSSGLENNEKEYTDVLYNNKVVGRIDQQQLNQVSITNKFCTFLLLTFSYII